MLCKLENLSLSLSLNLIFSNLQMLHWQLYNSIKVRGGGRDGVHVNEVHFFSNENAKVTTNL